MIALHEHLTIAPPEPLVGGATMFVATAAEIDAWLRRAGAGDCCVYARVARLDRGLDGATLARRAAAQALVTLRQTRHAPASPLFDYIARRTALPIRAEAAAVPPSDDALTADARRVLDHLARQADQEAPASTNRGIARACGLKDEDAARYQLRRLRALGKIIVKPVPADPGRQIIIVETGARTGLVGRDAERRRA